MSEPQCFNLTPVKRFRASGGFFEPSTSLACTIGAPAPLLPHARLLKSVLKTRLEHTTYHLASDYTLSIGTAPPPPEPSNHPEAYTIFITASGISARSQTPVGLFRCCATLAALLATGTPIACGIIEDEPEKAIRGVMLDVSRNRVWSLETLYQIADRLALLRMNRLELYFENSFAYSAHPTSWANTSPYTAADMAALTAYCNERFITLVPNQNTLGHFERWFLADADYLRFAELPQGGAKTPWGSIQTTPTGLCTSDAETAQFIEGLLEELLPCFPHADSANLGGDEVFDLGQGRSAGKGTPADLYLGHLRRVADVALRHGKRPEFWADMLLRHPAFLPQAKEMIPEARWILWGYEATDPLVENAKKLREAGLDFLVSPGSSSWRSFCGRTTNMLGNIRAAASISCDGLILTDWGDAGHWQPLAVSLPPLVFAAQLAWRADTSERTLAAAVDALVNIRGLGEFLLTLGDTYVLAKAESGNATQLFKAYNLPLEQAPAWDREALLRARDATDALISEGAALGDSLLAREARFALELQRLAIARALGMKPLVRRRAGLAATLQLLWLARGPVARLKASLTDFLAPELP